MADDCITVAAQVHDDTTAAETSPVFTVLPAVLNTSDVLSSLLYRLSTNVQSIIPKAIQQRPSVYDDPMRYCSLPKRKPKPMMSP